MKERENDDERRREGLRERGCERQRQGERQRSAVDDRQRGIKQKGVYMSVCVCERERDNERECSSVLCVPLKT